jgi:hypothetical protein
MQSQQNFKLTATPQGILMDGVPLHKCDLSRFPRRALSHLRHALELSKTMTPEDWGPVRPHGFDDIPVRALFEADLALAGAELNKSGFNPDELRDALGRWVAGVVDGIVPSAAAAELNSAHASSKAPGKSKSKNNQGKDIATRDHNTRQMNQFFNTLDAKLSRLSDELGLPREYIEGLSAHESKYWGEHGEELNNPFGLTQAGHNNLRYQSVDDAIAYWKKQYGDQVRGATSPEDFVQRLQGKKNGVRQKGWHQYNVKDPAWEAKVLGMITSVKRRRVIWQRMLADGDESAQ